MYKQAIGLGVMGLLCLAAGQGGAVDYVDLNKNGTMEPYENPDLSVALRVDDLVSRMTTG